MHSGATDVSLHSWIKPPRQNGRRRNLVCNRAQRHARSACL